MFRVEEKKKKTNRFSTTALEFRCYSIAPDAAMLFIYFFFGKLDRKGGSGRLKPWPKSKLLEKVPINHKLNLSNEY